MSENVACWDGFTSGRLMHESAKRVRHDLADAGKRYDWPRVLQILEKAPELINTTRPDGSSFYAPLHQAAHGGAPIEVAAALIGLGGWRTLQNARGERPLALVAEGFV